MPAVASVIDTGNLGRYHREKRKAEKRSAQKLLGDPENAEEELEKAEKLRAEVRGCSNINKLETVL